MRTAAVEALGSLPPHQREPLLQPSLEDPVRLVRTVAGRSLAGPAPAGHSRRQRRLRASAVHEYELAQRLHADHPGGRLNLGDLYRDQRDLERAEASYRQAIVLEPAFIPAYLNLADLYREIDREDEGKKLLLEALHRAPRSASAQHALGLLLVRTGQRRAALEHLAQAAELEPGNSRHAYVYGVALNSLGESARAIRVLEQALGSRPHDRDLLFALATIHRDRREFGKALVHGRRLLELYPEGVGYQRLEKQLRTLARIRQPGVR